MFIFALGVFYLNNNYILAGFSDKPTRRICLPRLHKEELKLGALP